MSKTTKCWKVVKKRSLVSAMSHILNKNAIKYKVGEFVKAEGGCLFTFETLQRAERFVKQLSFNDIPYSVYEAEGRGRVKKIVFTLAITDYLKQLFRLRSQKKRFSHLLEPNHMPYGTLGFKEVKLIKKVA